MVKAVTPIPFVKARFFDRCGKPLAGGKVYTYEANTTTAKTTYKDPYGLTPNTNPIILDAAGEADIYLDGTYRIRITDRNDVLVNDVEKIGSWFSDNLQDTLDNISGAINEALKPVLQNLDNAINTAAAAGAGANGWTTDLVVENGLTQKQINAVLFHNIYYAEREDISVNNSDNSTAWDNLHSRLNHGDEVIFGAGIYKFSRPMSINKVIKLRGKDMSYTQFNFYNQTHGIVRSVRGGYLSDIFINGTKSNVLFDFNNYNRHSLSVGNIGLYDKYDESENFGSYNTTTNVSIQGFDVGRANVAEKSAIWNGAYRESYNVRINRNRCGLLVLNGATDEKYYGGLISANSDVGVWVFDDGGMYNNVKFMGTTIEGNGTYDQNVGFVNASPAKCNIYVGGNSSVYLIGSYNEKCYNIIENGGQLYKIGSHQHSNAIDTTKSGFVYYSGMNWGDYYKIPYYNRLSSFLYGFSGATVTTVTGSKGVRITSQVNQSSVGYSIRSRLIPLPSGITADDVKGLKFSVKYKITSGFTQPTDLKLVPEIYVYAKDGSYAGIRDAVWSNYQTTSGNGKQTEMSIVGPIAVTTTPANWNINKGAELSHVLIVFGFKNAGGSYPDFSTNNLDMTIDDLEVGIFARGNINLVEYRNNVGTTAERPLLIATDKGYKYFDTTLAAEMMWDGVAWVALPKMSDIPTVVTSATYSAISQKIATINTTGKTQGKLVFNVSDSKLYYATGTTPEATWKASDNSSSITPV